MVPRERSVQRYFRRGMAGQVQPESDSERGTDRAFSDGLRNVGRALSGFYSKVQDALFLDCKPGATGKRWMGFHRAKTGMGTLQVRPHASERIQFRLDDHRPCSVFVS